MKSLLLIFMLIFSFNVIHGQKILDVKMESQQTDSWCWAACIDMIVKFHQPSRQIHQLRLAEFSSQSYGDFKPAFSDTNSIICEDKNRCSECAKNIDATISEQAIDNYQNFDSPQILDSFFSLLGYNSNQDNIKITKREVKKQINSCMPFIIDLKFESSIHTGFHYMVVKGYAPKDTSLFLLVNDPSEVCTGCEYFINYRVINTKGFYVTNSADFVRNIKPRNSPDCNYCKSNKNISKKVKSFPILKKLKDAPSTIALDDKKGKKCQIRYISYDNVDSLSNLNNDLKLLLIPKEVVAVETSLYSGIYEYVNDKWILISTPSCEKINDISVNVDGENITLKCDGEQTLNKDSYEIIKYPLFNYSFYRFIYNDKKYLSPFQDYKIDNNETLLKARNGYEESNVVKKLKKLIPKKS